MQLGSPVYVFLLIVSFLIFDLISFDHSYNVFLVNALYIF